MATAHQGYRIPSRNDPTMPPQAKQLAGRSRQRRVSVAIWPDESSMYEAISTAGAPPDRDQAYHRTESKPIAARTARALFARNPARDGRVSPNRQAPWHHHLSRSRADRDLAGRVGAVDRMGISDLGFAARDLLNASAVFPTRFARGLRAAVLVQPSSMRKRAPMRCLPMPPRPSASVHNRPSTVL